MGDSAFCYLVQVTEWVKGSAGLGLTLEPVSKHLGLSPQPQTLKNVPGTRPLSWERSLCPVPTAVWAQGWNQTRPLADHLLLCTRQFTHMTSLPLLPSSKYFCSKNGFIWGLQKTAIWAPAGCLSGRASARPPKGPGFDSQSGEWEATKRCVSLTSIFFSHSPSLPSKIMGGNIPRWGSTTITKKNCDLGQAV